MPPDFDAIVERVPCQPKLHIEVSSSIKGDTFSAGSEGLVDWAVLRKIVALILALHAPICKHLWSSGYDVSLTR